MRIKKNINSGLLVKHRCDFKDSCVSQKNILTEAGNTDICKTVLMSKI